MLELLGGLILLLALAVVLTGAFDLVHGFWSDDDDRSDRRVDVVAWTALAVVLLVSMLVVGWFYLPPQEALAAGP